MRLIASLTAAVALSASVTLPVLAQDSQSMDIGVFDRIDAAGQFRVVVIQGDTHSVRLEGDGGEFDEVSVSLNRGELELDQDMRWFGNNRSVDVTVYVTAPSFTHMEFGRGIGAEVRDFEADARDFEADALDLEISTGAVVRMTGSCDELDLSMSTGAVLYGEDYVCTHVRARASTGSSGDIHATGYADVRASMGADCDVYGNPENRELRSSMGASVRLVRPRS